MTTAETKLSAKLQQITQRLAHLQAWRQSAVTLAAYAERSGQSASRLRAWAGWESRWRAQLEAAARTGADRGAANAFVRVTAPSASAHVPLGPQAPGFTVSVTRAGSAISASAHWPTGATLASAAWLREVLA